MRKQSNLSQDVIEMKDSIQVFFTILDTFNIKIQETLRQSCTHSHNSVFKELFKTFCMVRRE
jgi:hypothetical protein